MKFQRSKLDPSQPDAQMEQRDNQTGLAFCVKEGQPRPLSFSESSLKRSTESDSVPGHFGSGPIYREQTVQISRNVEGDAEIISYHS